MARSSKSSDEEPVEAVTAEEAEAQVESDEVKPEPARTKKKPSDPFPLPEGHYFYKRSMSKSGHFRGSGVEKIEGRLGEPQTGLYDEGLVRSVESFQREKGLPVSGVVDAATWDAMFNG